MHWTMLRVGAVFVLLVQGVWSFMIHDRLYSQCLQDSLENRTLQVKPCDSTNDLQRWFWEAHHILVNKGTGRCLSGHRVKAVLTTPCDDSIALRWRCHGNKLISHAGALEVTSNGRVVTQVSRRELPGRTLLDVGEVCSPKRYKRASGDLDDRPVEGSGADQQGAAQWTMTEEQRAFFQWYYRTEDPSSWKYAMLALSFGALLLGSVLLVMGVMANRNRKKIARYKASLMAVKMEELQGLTRMEQACTPILADSPPQTDSPKEIQTPTDLPQVSHLNGKAPKDIHPPVEGATTPLRDREAPQDIEIPQEIQTPQDSEIPQEIQTPQDSEIPQEIQSPQDSEIPQEIQTPQDSEIPQEIQTPQGSEIPQEIQTPQDSESPEEIQTPQDSIQPEDPRPVDTDVKDTAGSS